ncbi:hypothetical protein [Marinobacter nauticus]|jgi:hypothetical protein|uniref:Uncharacterized protein n=1 Tax=Marinobacter nauticus (strain ATCC 700491 / DSM 11845 / VT8) TaxID=351348 RepID=A1U280_MARN8|nr:hypothetical protein [Marinobacter nauticus]ABM19099.1 hypothetical protein Maqu_2018 [Marinobacter nauticus VT8]
MSFKDTFRLRIDRLARQVGPLLEESWREARQRLDDLNQALASQAVPGERRARVSELALKRKGQQAGQKSAEIRPFPEQGKTVQRSDFDQ